KLIQSLDSQFAPSRHNESHSCASYGTSMRAMVTSKFHSLSKNTLSDARTVANQSQSLRIKPRGVVFSLAFLRKLDGEVAKKLAQNGKKSYEARVAVEGQRFEPLRL